MKQLVLPTLSVLLLALPSFAQETLRLGPDDVRIEESIAGGFFVYIRDNDAIGSVLATESTELPDASVNTFAYQSPNPHPENRDERRILDGEFLDDGRHYLIDSTPIADELFGSAFRIFVPYVIEYGFPWTRNDEVEIVDGTFISLRTFSEPFADYRGSFQDNPFEFTIVQLPPVEVAPDLGAYVPETLRSFDELSEVTEGISLISAGPDDTAAQVLSLLQPAGGGLDLVLALDTTQSMNDDIPVLRDTLLDTLSDRIAEYDTVRIGFMLYRDYLEDYLVRRLAFSDDLAVAQDRLNRIRVAGGRDLPEAVYEALWGSLEGFEWDPSHRRQIILIGDAPPHPRPRGAVTAEQVHARAKELGVRIDTIILPQ